MLGQTDLDAHDAEAAQHHHVFSEIALQSQDTDTHESHHTTQRGAAGRPVREPKR